MKITFGSRKIQKIFNSEKELAKEYGSQQCSKIKTRMKVLEAAVSLAEIPTQKPERLHALKGERKNQFAVDLVHPYRLILEVEGEMPLQPNGEIDKQKITEIVIVGVEDYHG